MAKKWYVVQVQGRRENTVKTRMEKVFKTIKGKRPLGKIIIPVKKVVGLVEGKRKESMQKLYPGYVFVHVDMSPENWHRIKALPGVTGFPGGNEGTIPKELPKHEIDRILGHVSQEEKAVPETNFKEGERVRIMEGPFADFVGTISLIKKEKQRLKVSVTVFGRPTDVEIDTIQVEHAA